MSLGARPPRLLLLAAAVLAAAALLVPWPVTVTGRFVAAPLVTASLVAPDSASLERVYAGEGTLVHPGQPVVQLRDFALQQREFEYERTADSLANRAEVVRAAEGESEHAQSLSWAERQAGARFADAQAQVAALRLRSPIAGVVITPGLAGEVGRWVPAGAVVAQVVGTDSVELRVALPPGRAGARVAPGDAARVISRADASWPLAGAVAAVAPAAGDPGGAAAERVATIRVPAIPPGWRPGVTGLAKIRIGRTSALGALWNAIR